MAVEAKVSNYWIASNAIYIKLNAMGEGNYIQGNVAANAYILCYIPGIEGLGFDSGHNYRRWQLILYPSIFPDNFRKYVYVAIPRVSKEGNSMAMVVFPSVKVDIYGVALESLEDLDIEAGQQIGSEDYYYIYLQGIIGENTPSDNGYQREWVEGYEVNTGTLASDESLSVGGDGSWWQYNAVSDSVTFLKKVLTATFGAITATTLDIKKVFFGDKTISGVATSESSEQSETDIVTPAYLEMFGVKHFLAKDKDDEASGLISFLEGIKIGASKLFGIAKDGAARFFSLSIEGDTQLGKNGTSTSFGSFNADSTGARISVGEDGTSTAEFDYINIRRAAQFREITIKELRHIGGELAISAAAMVCSKVERLDASGNVIVDGEAKAFRCYFDTSASDGAAQKVFQQFKVGDQARCQQFGLEGTTEETAKCTRYYWRLVTEVGDDYIVLSDVDKDPLSTVEPQAGDNIVQLGYRYEGDTSRQSAIILSATSGDAPSAKYYQGINDYSLDHLVKDEGYENGAFHSNVYGNSYTGDKDGNSYFSYDAAKKTATFKGKAVFTHGTELPDGTAIEDVTTKKDLENFNIRSGNLLRNTAFSGDYESRDVSGDMDVSEETETFSEKLKYWSTDGHIAISADNSSMSGRAATIGSLSQRLDKSLLDGEPYTLSFVGKGSLLIITIGESLVLKQQLAAESKRYELHFANEGASDVVSFSSDNATISDIMLSYGTIAPAWSPAYVDNDKSMAQFQSVKYLRDAITEGSTTIDGGLVMSQMFKVGNFRDKQMIQETGGMSGYYNDGNSPYLWGGGSYEQAIHTIQKYKDNPTYQPTEEELKDMANFVVTHGGRAILNDIILRGIIYAEGGVMKSIKSPNGNFEIDEEGNAKLNGHIEAGDGKVGGFSINQNSLYYGDPSKWATTKTENLAQVGWNFIRIAQAITYGENPIAYQKIGIGGNAYPGDEEDSSVVGSTAMYIYRSMLAYSEDKSYKPAAIIESDNVQDRNIALRLIGGLQVHGGVIQRGRVMTYEKKGDVNALNLSFGTIFTLRNTMEDSMDFFFPSLPEVRQQLGVDDVNDEFCVPVTVIAAANTNKFAVSTALAAANTDLTQADGGRYVDNNGNWDYGNDKGYGGNRIVMANGDCWSFSLTFTKAQGYYIQILNKQV